MRLCKDCKFFFDNIQVTGNRNAICHHPQSERYDDPVYGNHTKKSCRVMRQVDELCGISGKLWIASAAFTPEEYPTL